VGRLDGAALARLHGRLAAARDVLPGRAAVVTHADPWYGNMLIDDAGHLAALLDFEGLCVADPAYDLAALTYFTPPTNDRAIAAYLARTGPLDDADERIEAYLLIRELWGLAYALRNDLPDETEHAFADVLGLVED
jgi:aminoglycoside phosphotransferase (APT) family kinase protein